MSGLQQLAQFLGTVAKMLAHYAAYENEMYDMAAREAHESLRPGPFDHLCRFCGEPNHAWPC